MSCSNSSSDLGSSGGSGSGSGSGSTPSVTVYNNGVQATWNGVNITPRSLGCNVLSNAGPADTLEAGSNSSLLITAAVAPTNGCSFTALDFGLPAPGPASGPSSYLGINASGYANGSVSFDCVILNALVDHFELPGVSHQSQLTFSVVGGVGIWGHYSVPAAWLFGSELADLPYALQIRFDIVASPSPFAVQNGFTNGMQVAAINNLVWAP
jgi:hypothetical protein